MADTSLDLTLYSTSYLEPEPPRKSVGYISQRRWQRLMDGLPDCRRLFAHILFESGMMGVTRTCALEGIDCDEEHIYLPLWMIPHDEEVGVRVHVDILTRDAFPEATRIVLKPMDSAFYNTNAQEELSAILTELGVLTHGQMVLIPLRELGGYEVPFYVAALEPADICLMDGEEVAVEFEEAADRWNGRPPTPPPPQPALLVPPSSEDGGMIPYSAAVPQRQHNWGTGHVVGDGGRNLPRVGPDGRPYNPWRYK